MITVDRGGHGHQRGAPAGSGWSGPGSRRRPPALLRSMTARPPRPPPPWPGARSAPRPRRRPRRWRHLPSPGHRGRWHPVTATVSLTSSAPGGGVAVALSSNNPTAATVPPSVTVPAGSTAATFTVTTNPVANPQSSIIIGTAGGATRVCHPDREDRVPGHQRQCLAGPGWDGGAGGSPPSRLHRHRDHRHLRQRLFPAGTQVRLEARPAQGSSFLGWEFETTCRDAPKVTVAAGVAYICRPVFRQK